MTVIESKIGKMLTYLRQGLPMAKVDHRWSGMMHTFIIVRGGLIYQIGLPESVITVRAEHELKRMVQPGPIALSWARRLVGFWSVRCSRTQAETLGGRRSQSPIALFSEI